jgi:methionyl-tRNA synthetase
VRRTQALVARNGLTHAWEERDSTAVPLVDVVRTARARVDAALHDFDFRHALDGLLAIVAEGNRYIEATRPWEHPADLTPLVAAVDALGAELEPFVPDLAARIRADDGEPVFRRLALPEFA